MITGRTIVTMPQPRLSIDIETPSARSVGFRTVYTRPCQASTRSLPVEAVSVCGSAVPTNTSADTANSAAIRMSVAGPPTTWTSSPASGGPISVATT